MYLTYNPTERYSYLLFILTCSVLFYVQSCIRSVNCISRWRYDRSVHPKFLFYPYITFHQVNGSGEMHKYNCFVVMMTSSNGNIFRVTGPLCGEFTGPGEFPTQRTVTRSFDVFFDLRLNKRLSKQSWGWWFETLSLSLWRHCNGTWYCCSSICSPSSPLTRHSHMKLWCDMWHKLNISPHDNIIQPDVLNRVLHFRVNDYFEIQLSFQEWFPLLSQ